MRVTDEMVELACNAYDTYNRSRNQILLRGVATGGGMKAALETTLSIIKPLSEDEIIRIVKGLDLEKYDYLCVARAIEKAHGIGKEG
jgi:hypothetical protein